MNMPSEVSPLFNQHDQPLNALARNYLEHLLAGQRQQATGLILQAVDDGNTVKDIYLQVFQPVQLEVGHLWQTNQISVAQEHFCTAVTQSVMAQLYPHIFSKERKNRKIVIACVGGELHELGARMVADFFEMEGWDTYYIGANTPSESILKTIEEQQPDLLGVSVTITFNVPQAVDLIAQARSLTEDSLKILVGGRAFNVAPDLWRSLNADGYGLDAEAALQLADQFSVS